MEFTFTADATDVSLAIGGIVTAMNDMSGGLQEVSEMQQEFIDSQYSSEGSKILGNKWTKRKKNYAWPILDNTGKMKGSHEVVELSAHKLSIGNSTKYFQYHQTGTSKMAQRMVHGHSDEMIEKTLDILVNYIVNQAR